MVEIVRAADVWRSKLSGVVETEIRAYASLISHAGFRYGDIVRQYRIQLHFLRFPHALAAAVRALRLSDDCIPIFEKVSSSQGNSIYFFTKNQVQHPTVASGD